MKKRDSGRVQSEQTKKSIRYGDVCNCGHNHSYACVEDGQQNGHQTQDECSTSYFFMKKEILKGFQ